MRFNHPLSRTLCSKAKSFFPELFVQFNQNLIQQMEELLSEPQISKFQSSTNQTSLMHFLLIKPQVT